MEIHHIKSFINNNSLEIKTLYNEHRGMFIGFGKKYGLSGEDLADIYQEAFLALRKHAISGKLDTVNSSLRTYLFGIGKYLIFNELRKKEKLVSLKYEPETNFDVDEISIDNAMSLTIEQSLLRQNFQKLGKKCKDMLTMHYYRGLTNEEIMEEAGYENENVVRSTKSRCLKTLKEIINSPK
ncbi:MAG: RNA polymerase subunit sigma-24 [Flavobacterium sp.]|nr:MAG: RNA polymerase subunit sigma-24 [Flavobacterium sp.]